MGSGIMTGTLPPPLMIICSMCGGDIWGTYTGIHNSPSPPIILCHDCEPIYFEYRDLNAMEW
jgi:hypothetical protein